MKAKNVLNCAVRGFIVLSIVSISFTFYEIVSRADIKQYYVKFANTYQSSETEIDKRVAHNIMAHVDNLGNTIADPTTNHSSRTEVSEVRIKHRCYHLNWNESALTPEVFSRCGFITLGRRRGRMGNNMFQIAALFGTAYRLDLIPVLRPTFPLLDQYNLPNVMSTKLTNLQNCDEKHGRFYFDCDLGQTTNLINITLLGLRQSWKYFDVIENDIKRIFSKDFTRNSLNKAADFLKNISNSSFQHVGIHIRRTDLLRNKMASAARIPGVEYFTKAMTYFKIFYKRVHFIALSDDIAWAQANLTSDDIFYSPFTSAADDMALMSLCDHMIVTYGTFGWWGAWLAGGNTVFFREKDKTLKKIATSDNSHYFIKGSLGIA